MKTTVLASIAVALLSGSAMAADPPAIYDPPVLVSAPEVEGGMYVSLFGGVSFVGDYEYDIDFATLPLDGTGTSSFETGYSVDAALGYDFGNGLSVEGQVGYLHADQEGAELGTFDPTGVGEGSITYGMLNAWFGFDLGGITPFVGAGIGAASVAYSADMSAGSTDILVDDSATTWAAQVGAGVSVEVAEGVALTGRYRYLMTGEYALEGELVGPDDDFEITGSASVNIVDVGLKFSF